MKLNILAVSLIFYFLPFVTNAGFIPCEGTSCSFCHFLQMGNTIITWLIGMMFVIFAAVVVSAGWGLVTSGGNQAALSEAKEKFTNSIIGLLIVLSAWILVDTIMRGLLSGGQGVITGYGPWSRVECSIQSATGIVREGNNPEFASANGAVNPVNPTEATVSGVLPADKFTILSSGNCTDRTSSSCTSLDGIRPTTLQRVTELQQQVGVPFVITGGTETGHADGQYSHGNGYKVDIRPNNELNNYIYSNFTKIGATKYQDTNGNTYYRHEPDHWDVTITN